MSSDFDYLAWIDLETDGVEDPFYATILEFALVITNNNYDWLLSYQRVLPFRDPPLFYRFMHPDNKVVRDMHIKSGLLNDCLNLWDSNYNEIKHVLNEEVSSLVLDTCGESKPVLAGSGVSHFDSRILSSQLPEIWKLLDGYNDFTKPTFDIGVVRRFFNNSGIEVSKVGNHRALDDCLAFIEQAKTLKNLLLERPLNG